MKRYIIFQLLCLSLINIGICQSENNKYAAVVVHKIQKISAGSEPDTSKLVIYFGPDFDKDSVKTYVNNRIFDKRKIEINASVDVEFEIIPNVKNIHTVGISLNSGNIVSIKIKPKIYVMRIDLENSKRIFHVRFFDEYPLYE